MSARLETPSTLVMTGVSEAKRKLRPLPVFNIAMLNAELVQVVVTPSTNITEADSVEDLVIHRDGRLIRPLRSRVTPTTYQTLMGAKRVLGVGRFVFDFKTFDPSAEVTVTLIGAGENAECTLSREELGRMK